MVSRLKGMLANQAAPLSNWFVAPSPCWHFSGETTRIRRRQTKRTIEYNWIGYYKCVPFKIGFKEKTSKTKIDVQYTKKYRLAKLNIGLILGLLLWLEEHFIAVSITFKNNAVEVPTNCLCQKFWISVLGFCWRDFKRTCKLIEWIHLNCNHYCTYFALQFLYEVSF